MTSTALFENTDTTLWALSQVAQEEIELAYNEYELEKENDPTKAHELLFAGSCALAKKFLLVATLNGANKEPDSETTLLELESLMFSSQELTDSEHNVTFEKLLDATTWGDVAELIRSARPDVRRAIRRAFDELPDKKLVRNRLVKVLGEDPCWS
ncbi:hypothetical protein MK805_14525 [Shimazuella sp. AN120528]|uniref:hypothetical protein n=1 Tax=Shimazuella soli TaxID=1892854 RepID=UPI001F10E265|nr:hypothetical protein [Shimazuella soli]MCH5586154.1 hypothetical protein [Shimazuella soli]